MRKSVPAKTTDEQTYAVRIRIAVPVYWPRNLDELHGWLREATKGIYVIQLLRTVPKDHMFICVDDPVVAVACVKTFDLQLLSYAKGPPRD